MYQQAADQLLPATRLDPANSLVEQLVQGMDVHPDYFAVNRNAVLAASRVLSGDPATQTITTNDQDALRALRPLLSEDPASESRRP